jgi:hypothetical protein
MPGTAPEAPTISTMMRTIRIEPTGVDCVVPEAACAAGGRTLKGCGVAELVAQAVLPAATVSASVRASGEVDAAGDVDAVGEVDAAGDADAAGDVDAAGAAAQVAAAVDPVVGVVPPPAVVLPPPVVVPPPPVDCCWVPLDEDVARGVVVGRPEGFPAAAASVFSLVTTDRA